jgi:hypothetical protein
LHSSRSRSGTSVIVDISIRIDPTDY